MIRPIAFYLPQYHPIPENDASWGEGFTDWFNVSRARPLFDGHYQPHLPSDLGYYDPRDPQIRFKQVELARTYGICGFCFYHYWFDGKRLLNEPLDGLLADGKPDFPFCLCWANESWTKNWDGGNREILIEQHYSNIDARNHIRWLLNVFQDRRYIRIDGKPLFLIYCASKLPGTLVSIWREEAREAGEKGLYLCKVESFPLEHREPAFSGFDAAVEFQPDWAALKLMTKVLRRITMQMHLEHHDVIEYEDFVRWMLAKKIPAYKRYPCVTPSWDNSSRRKSQSMILKNSTPEKFAYWLKMIKDKFEPYSPEENLLFINAWNEWAEGAHLEPDQKWGHGYLEAVHRVMGLE